MSGHAYRRTGGGRPLPLSTRTEVSARIGQAAIEALSRTRLAMAVRRWLISGGDPGATGPDRLDDQRCIAPEAAAAFRRMCNGALAEIAFDCLAPRRIRTLALIGTSPEAGAMLAGALGLRRYAEVRIYSSRPVAAAELARKMRRIADLRFDVCASPEEALHLADAVLLCAGTARPIIDADWVAAGAHVGASGPQTAAGHEVPRALIHRARTIVSDDPHFVRASRTHLLDGETALRRVKGLGNLLDGFNPDRDRGMTLFMPSGNPGLPAAVFNALLPELAR